MVKKVVKKVVTTETVNDDGTKKTVVKEHAPKTLKKKRKARSHKRSSTHKRMTAREREELMIENFVGLQHAMTNMSIKFGGLSDNISKLLQVFEESAKNFVGGGKYDDTDMIEKIDSLLNQNKTIAKGLVLMEGKLRSRNEESRHAPPQMMQPKMSQMQMSSSQNMPPKPQVSPTRPKPLPSI